MQLQERLALSRLNKVYCKLQPSPLHGVGIFAIRTIPKGVNPFKDSFMGQQSLLVPKDKIPDDLSGLLNDYHPSSNNKQIVTLFPNQIMWTNYLNYCDEDHPANVQLLSNGEWAAMRQINVGEELLEDPNHLFNPDGSHKVFSVKEGQYPSLRYF